MSSSVSSRSRVAAPSRWGASLAVSRVVADTAALAPMSPAARVAPVGTVIALSGAAREPEPDPTAQHDNGDEHGSPPSRGSQDPPDTPEPQASQQAVETWSSAFPPVAPRTPTAQGPPAPSAPQALLPAMASRPVAATLTLARRLGPRPARAPPLAWNERALRWYGDTQTGAADRPAVETLQWVA